MEAFIVNLNAELKRVIGTKNSFGPRLVVVNYAKRSIIIALSG